MNVSCLINKHQIWGGKKKAEMSAIRSPLEGQSEMNPAFKIKGLRGFI